jgi:hypothetical protein
VRLTLLRNIDDFDLPYIVRRAATLPGRPDIRGLGRRRDAKISAEPTRFSSKQLGTRESFSLKGVEGVHFLDEWVCRCGLLRVQLTSPV